MNEREKNDERCQSLLNRVVTALALEFVPAKNVTEEGWYIWRNNDAWPIDSYEICELAEGKIRESEPSDSYGATWELNWREPYGQLAGPIIGR